ncbi:SDR family NAD(P)-dependent oxidoreductase [Kribbella sp. CA-293567]|uniref:SDR family NAD(P)-dependent oxidoreductase n=1 Tax=Kribbella sp. CA-293567 TaxID=3002436 RepID=UPI0022DDA003|nr:SDR family NAD(P)-dependent oxidoreductase [Kribbella sp. CA-293567]WBQ06138.1 SDR family NAD(P)-dependent oxidoreductase [Kribbella sp. CA-293567]
MELQLAGKRALVTGSSAGLGESVAKLLAAEGVSVVVHGRDAAKTEQVVKAIEAEGNRATFVLGDLGTDEGAAQVAATAGAVDILVNNAGYFEPARGWTDLGPADWAEMYNVNVLSSVRLIERLVPGMRERGWGRVIQIGSVVGIVPQAKQPHYSASSAARHALATSLARELKETGVTSNAVAPGGILTEVSERNLTLLGRSQGWGTTWAEIEPNLLRALAPNDIGRISRPDEIANAVVYLASPLAGSITGSTLQVDGGWYDAPAA